MFLFIAHCGGGEFQSAKYDRGRCDRHGLPCHPDGHGLEEYGLGAPRAADRRRPQDALSVSGDSGRHPGDRPPPPHTTTVDQNVNGVIYHDTTVVSPQVEQGGGLVPAKINSVIGEPMRTISGHPRPRRVCHTAA
jgi:hypothetical protein